jgi:hypothetical protein
LCTTIEQRLCRAGDSIQALRSCNRVAQVAGGRRDVAETA